MSDNDCNILKLKDFDTNIISGWKGLQNDTEFCDVTLVCDENQIKLHKIVASTSSLVLRNILKKNPQNHPLIYLRGVKYTHLVNLVDFIYQGEIKIPQDEMNDLFNLAKDLQVVGLSKNIEEEYVDINIEDTKNIYKHSSSKINIQGKVEDINKDISKTNYVAEEEVVAMNEESDDVKRYYIVGPAIKTNVVSQKFPNSKRTIKESCKDTNETKRNKFERSVKKNSLNDRFSYKEEDITELVPQFGYKQENDKDITHKETVDLKQSLDYNEDLHKNMKVIANEFLVKNANTETNVDKPLQSNFECGQCNTKFSEPSSLMAHIKSIHEELAKKQLRAIENKRNKIEPYMKNEVNYEQQDITKFSINYGFQSKKYNAYYCAIAENNGTNLPIESVDITEDDVRGLSSSCDIVSPDIEMRKTRNQVPVYKTNTEQEGASLSEPVKHSYRCEECNTKFTQSDSLSRHIRSIHEGLSFSCDKCQYTATQNTSLIRHVKSVHDKIRYTCDLCAYSSTQKPILNKHLRMKH